MIRDEFIDLFRVRPGAILDQNLQDLTEAQGLLYSDDRYAVLIVFQAMDEAGKEGPIKHVMSGVNHQGWQVFSFKKLRRGQSRWYHGGRRGLRPRGRRRSGHDPLAVTP